MNLARELAAIEPKISTAPWADYEYARGYAVMALPFSSGHLLGLRVFPENDFAPYKSVWHRTPEGEWSIYNDGPSLATTCPRWWGPVLKHAALVPLSVTWTGPNELRVEMEAKQLVWTMSMSARPIHRVLNAVSASLPLWTWKPAPLVRVREWMAKHVYDMGDLRFTFEAPTGRYAIVMAEKLFIIDSSSASWEGRDLGEPVQLDANPTIGDIPLPTRPSFVVGQGFGRITDRDEYERTRARMNME